MRYPLRWLHRSMPLDVDTTRGGGGALYFFGAQGSPANSPRPPQAGHARSVPEPQLKDRVAALAASEARYQSLTLLGSDWHWDQDVQSRFTAINGNLADPIGATIAKHLGRTLWQMPQIATLQGRMECVSARGPGPRGISRRDPARPASGGWLQLRIDQRRAGALRPTARSSAIAASVSTSRSRS